MSEIIVTDVGSVRRIAISRPAKRNALTQAMYEALANALATAPAAGVRAIWLSGGDECFTGGNDLADFANADADRPSAVWAFLEQLAACDVPLVASVNGAAVGIGTTMLLHCDLACCSERARFQLPFVNLGLCPEAGSTLLLPLSAGPRLAAELLLLGEPFDAATAQRAGIVNAVLAGPVEAAEWGLARAEALAAKPRDALRTTRALLRRRRDVLAVVMREEGAEIERLLQCADAREAVAAAMEKRPPVFAAP